MDALEFDLLSGGRKNEAVQSKKERYRAIAQFRVEQHGSYFREWRRLHKQAVPCDGSRKEEEGICSGNKFPRCDVTQQMKDGIGICCTVGISVCGMTHNTHTTDRQSWALPRRTGYERGQRGVLWWKAWPFPSTWIEAEVTTKGGCVVGAQRNKGQRGEGGEVALLCPTEDECCG